MKKQIPIVLAGVLALSLAVGCEEKTPKVAAQNQPAAAQPGAQPEATAAKNGKVVETMNSGGYTYIQVDTGAEKVWAAAPQFTVQVGDAVLVPAGLAMTNYESKSLNRTFDLVYFVNSVMVAGADGAPAQAPGDSAQAGMPQGHPPIDKQSAAEVDFSGLEKAEGGKTVSEVYAEKGKLTGKEVVLRGKVVKFSPQIMGKNWIHLQDGTGADGTNDLTVTTADTAKVGDTVVVTGALATDKDFGYGYNYPVIVEDAKVVVE